MKPQDIKSKIYQILKGDVQILRRKTQSPHTWTQFTICPVFFFRTFLSPVLSLYHSLSFSTLSLSSLPFSRVHRCPRLPPIRSSSRHHSAATSLPPPPISPAKIFGTKQNHLKLFLFYISLSYYLFLLSKIARRRTNTNAVFFSSTFL